MTQDKDTSVQIPLDLYVGENVVRKHVAEFYYRNLLAAGEEILAVFDCVILEQSGRRLGGLTLHDYAILTSQHLITWGRGRNRDVVDKFSWSSVVLDKFGKRNPLEGVVKFIYKIKPVGNKRKIAIGKKNGNGNGHDEEAEIPPAQPNTKDGAVALYLDLMPSGDVKTCAAMIKHLNGESGDGSTDGFRNKFRYEIEQSTQRLTTIPELLSPFYIRQANGVYVEADAGEEEVFLKSVPEHYIVRGTPPSPYQLKSSPYQGTDRVTYRNSVPYQGSARVSYTKPSARPAPTPRSAPVARAAAPPPTLAGDNVSINAGSGRLNRMTRQYGTNATSNRSNTSTAPRARMDDVTAQASPRGMKENFLGETVTLSTSPINVPSKLEAYEKRGGKGLSVDIPVTVAAAPVPKVRAVESSSDAKIERVAPAQRPAVSRPAAIPRPTAIPRAERETGAGRAMDEFPANVQGGQRALAEPIILTLSKEAFNIYSISRVARGLWFTPQNVSRSVSDISETIGALIEIAGVLAEDSEVRMAAFYRLRKAVAQEGGILNSNVVFHYTIWPFVKPILDWIGTSGEPPVVRNRVQVRTEKTNGNGSGKVHVVVDDLPDLGTKVAQEVPVAVETPAKVPNLVEIAVGSGSFNTLVAAVQAAGLVDTLTGAGPFTVFAPPDEAFAKLPAGTVEALLQDVPKLAAILKYHIVPGKLLAKDVVGQTSLKTVQGQNLTISSSDGVRIDNAKVINSDIEASNGVIHVIDSVLLPKDDAPKSKLDSL